MIFNLLSIGNDFKANKLTRPWGQISGEGAFIVTTEEGIIGGHWTIPISVIEEGSEHRQGRQQDGKTDYDDLDDPMRVKSMTIVRTDCS